jgi:hypothetical protein
MGRWVRRRIPQTQIPTPSGSAPTAQAIGTGGNPQADPVVHSFVSVGCSRVAGAELAGNASSTNVAEVLQTFTDVAGMDSLPREFFMTGDFINGYAKDDGSTVRSQLANFATLFWAHPISEKVTFVPFTGNHELLYRDSAAPANFLPATHQVWRDWLTSNRFNFFAGNFDDDPSNGPTNAGANPDNLVDDQSLFTYSFNLDGVHFTVINTDTLTTTPAIGTVPMDWITKDVQAAQANPEVKHIFLMGHKPINPAFGETGSDGMLAQPYRQAMTDLVRANTKVRAYVCAHAHLSEVTSLGDAAQGATGPLQIISGNGGTRLESYWDPSGGTFFGFVQVRVYQSGRTTYTIYHRPVPSPYIGPAIPAVPDAEVEISPSF